jgi:hypothetical protein
MACAPVSTCSTSCGSGVATERELWAMANMVLEQHGERAPLFVAERLGALALAGDAAGVAAWQAIARRVAALSAGLSADES